LKKNKDLTEATELTIFIKQAIDAINEIDDDILREIKIKELSKEYDISEDLIKSKINKKQEIIPIKLEKNDKKIKKKYNKYDVSEIRLLYLMLNNPELIKYYENHLGYMNDENRRKLANSIISYKDKNKTFDYADYIGYNNRDPELETTLKFIMEYPHIDEFTMEEVED